ncbi:MAG TPA: cytochrome c3 family protein [Bacteroidales bacterium]|nr:cytochrome c3 family protein [Bacteroidales bacterium]
MLNTLPSPGRTGFLWRTLTIGLFLLLIVVFPIQAQTPEAEKNFQQCRACHNIDGPKLVGPSLAGVTQRYTQDWLIRFIRNSQEMIQAGDPQAVKVWEEHNRIPMPPHNLTDEQIIDILAYIENGGKVAAEFAAAGETDEAKAAKEALAAQIAAEQEARQQRLLEIERDANRNFGTTFIISLLVLLIALVDLFVTKVVKARFVHITMSLVAVFIILEITYKEATALGRQQYYQPTQPIWFSHKVHSGQNQIDCKYCHSGVDYGKQAVIPNAGLCMNCHNVVRQGKITGTEQIAKIIQAWETGQPIEWVRVHNLPDHVYFNHAQHVNAGKLDCAECHGKIETMHEVMQVNDLSMGWCLNCHRTREVQFAGNGFYETYTKLHEQFKSGQISRVTPDMVGGGECMKCHY